MPLLCFAHLFKCIAEAEFVFSHCLTVLGSRLFLFFSLSVSLIIDTNVNLARSRCIYSVCVIVKDKCANTVIEAFLVSWLSVFGDPSGGILTDNGREIKKAQFRDMCEKLDLRKLSTTADCPFSNGICERGNAIVKIVFHEVRFEFPKTMRVWRKRLSAINWTSQLLSH